MTTLGVLLALAAKNKWHLQQLGINNRFLHGDLKELSIWNPHKGFYASSTFRVCKLKKSLYSLKQASRQWNSKLSNTLIHKGFTEAALD